MVWDLAADKYRKLQLLKGRALLLNCVYAHYDRIRFFPLFQFIWGESGAFLTWWINLSVIKKITGSRRHIRARLGHDLARLSQSCSLARHSHYRVSVACVPKIHKSTKSQKSRVHMAVSFFATLDRWTHLPCRSLVVASGHRLDARPQNRSFECCYSIP